MIAVSQGKFFPFTYRVIGMLVPFAVTIKFITNTVFELSLVFYGLALIIGGILIFTEWTLEIYPAEKIIRKNLQFLLFKAGSKQTFNQIEKIFINRVKQSFVFRPNTREITITEFLYKAFIKLDNGKKIVLDCDTDKEALIERLLAYNAELKTNILDNSVVTDPQWIVIEPGML